ncbi:hypothetical protein DLB95_07690 [Salmonella enterica subsp. diarizonae]|uniref:Uncharacterized protein n=6 Tax=Salmonella enterica TaxID=28901 RepID=A0A3T3KVJ1_SALDZ|nr:hypothetical protein DOE63_29605 [Salmonella enterica subsp. diarizonae serovar 59:z10:-]AXC71267.1 hypothetical protein DOE59_06440 [Salmonella enterica subsp. diarizonae serovar 48:i:z]AXD73196.1 hypothetical protein CHC34_21035 [Salmonella enterica]EAA0678373.1 hypothetical protein [Salmonella enterica subsp. diarizonae]EAA7929928.1 hypothetical protein [Salmonella enterica subsp. enterica serovar Redlands]EAW1160810.1 hypothetical protein [Salmonella enterica subsp. enterica]EBE3717768
MKFTTRIKHHSHEKVMANHANKKPPDVESFSAPALTAKKISQHPLAYGKLYLRKVIRRYFWQLNVPAEQS